MKNRFLTGVFSMIVFGAVLMSCTKEKIQPRLSVEKTVPDNARTTNNTTTSASTTTTTNACPSGHTTSSPHTGS